MVGVSRDDSGARWVAGYVHGHESAVLNAHATRTVDNSCAYMTGRIAPGSSILDVGCGPGTITAGLAALTDPGRVTGIDPSADAIDRARSLAQAAGATNLAFDVAALGNLDPEAERFDVVHAHQVLQHLADPVAAFKAMLALCAPGGFVAVRDADYGGMLWAPEVPGLELWREAYTVTARAAGGEPNAGRMMKGWALAAGVESPEVTASVWTYSTPEEVAWWSSSQASRVRHSTFTERLRDVGYSSCEVEDMASAWEEWGRSPDAWFMVPHGELIVTVPGA